MEVPGFRVPVPVPVPGSDSSMARVKSAIASAHRDVPASVMRAVQNRLAERGVEADRLGVVANRLVVLSVEAVHARAIGEGVRRARLERSTRVKSSMALSKSCFAPCTAPRLANAFANVASMRMASPKSWSARS